MPSALVDAGVEFVQRIISNLQEQISIFTGVRWVDLYGWMQLPQDIAAVVGTLFTVFSVFCLVGLVRKLIVIFG